MMQDTVRDGIADKESAAGSQAGPEALANLAAICLPGGLLVCAAEAPYELWEAGAGLLATLGFADFAELTARSGSSLAELLNEADRESALKELANVGPQPARIPMRLRLHGSTGGSVHFDAWGERILRQGRLAWRLLLLRPEGGGVDNGRDALTGLDGMMTFLSKLGAALREMTPSERQSHAVVYLNIENFKQLNRQMGFEAGSHFLKAAASFIEKYFSDRGGLLSRFGDDHFVVFTPVEGLQARLSSVQAKLRDYRADVRYELKAGVYRLAAEDIEPSLICDNARQACETVRSRFDRHVAYYDDELRSQLLLQRYIIDHFEEAMAQGWLQVYYQPVVRIISGRICCMEALARWQDPQRGILEPDLFVPVLERCQLVHRLDLYVLRRICNDIVRLQANRMTVVPCSINLSLIDFAVCDLVREFEDVVRTYNVPRSYVTIEITESAIARNRQELERTMNSFRQLGYQLWMDNFGTGYSSLNVLKDLDFNLIKFDMRFLKDFAVPSRAVKAREIIAATVAMAKRLNIQTLTEGVETEEQLDFLRSIGCEKAQGFLISRPQPPNRLEDFTSRFEEPAEAFYYDNLARVNLVNQSSLEGTEFSYADARPMAVVERRGADGSCRVLQHNDAFIDFLRSIGMYQITDLENVLNHGQGSQHAQVMGLLDECYRTHTEQNLDCLVNGELCNLRVRFIAENAQNHDAMYLTHSINLSRYTSRPKHERFERSVSAIIRVFGQVHLADLEADSIEIVHRAGSSGGAEVPRSLTETQHSFQTRILPQQQERARAFFDYTTLDRRIAARRRNFVSAVFSERDSAGIYVPKLYLLVPLNLDGRRQVIICCASLDELTPAVGNYGASGDAPDEDAPLSYSELWQALMEDNGSLLYWKDEAGRFSGVSPAFAGFFGTEQRTDIVGHTTAELGWGINRQKLEDSDREALAGKGVTVEDQCLINGVIHDLRIRKFPVLRNGRVRGLVGYVVVDPGSAAGAFTDTPSFTDAGTGVLDLGGLHEALIRFEYAFASNRTDFFMLRFSCENGAQFRSDNGRAYLRQTEKEVMSRILALTGNTGAVARTGELAGVIIKQVNDDSEQERLQEAVRKLFTDIRDQKGNYDVLHMKLECYNYKDRVGSKKIREMFN